MFLLNGFVIHTKLSFPVLSISSPSTELSFMWTVTEKTEWEREEHALSRVAAVCLLAVPLSNMAYTSFLLLTANSSSPWMTTEPWKCKNELITTTTTINHLEQHFSIFQPFHWLFLQNLQISWASNCLLLCWEGQTALHYIAQGKKPLQNTPAHCVHPAFQTTGARTAG